MVGIPYPRVQPVRVNAFGIFRNGVDPVAMPVVRMVVAAVVAFAVRIEAGLPRYMKLRRIDGRRDRRSAARKPGARTSSRWAESYTTTR